MATVVVGASAVAGAALTVPAVLFAAGAVLVVKAVASTARKTVYVLERASDGAHASIEVVGKGLPAQLWWQVRLSSSGAGVVLSAAGEAIAFIPNALGRALLRNESLTY